MIKACIDKSTQVFVVDAITKEIGYLESVKASKSRLQEASVIKKELVEMSIC